MKVVWKLTLAMVLSSAIGGAVLVAADQATRSARAKAALAEKQKALGAVLPEFDNDPVQEQVNVTTATRSVIFYRASKGGAVVGVAGESYSLTGYGGRIELLVGLTPEGAVRSVTVTSHRETPGLGSLVAERQQRRTLRELLGHAATSTPAPAHFLDQFVAVTSELWQNLKVKQDGGTVAAVTGATVTSRAVADAVQGVLEAFAGHRAELLAGKGREP